MPVQSDVEPAHHLGQPPAAAAACIKPNGERLERSASCGAPPKTLDDGDNIVWGTDCGDADCDNIVWGTARRRRQHRLGHRAATATTSSGAPTRDGDNIVWGTDGDGDNIVWGTTAATATATTSCGAPRGDGDNIVWGTATTATTSSGARRRRRQHRVGHERIDDNIVWGTAATTTSTLFDDDVDVDAGRRRRPRPFDDLSGRSRPVRRRQRAVTVALGGLSNGKDALPRRADGHGRARGDRRGRPTDTATIEHRLAAGAAGADRDRW